MARLGEWEEGRGKREEGRIINYSTTQLLNYFTENWLLKTDYWKLTTDHYKKTYARFSNKADADN